MRGLNPLLRVLNSAAKGQVRLVQRSIFIHIFNKNCLERAEQGQDSKINIEMTTYKAIKCADTSVQGAIIIIKDVDLC